MSKDLAKKENTSLALPMEDMFAADMNSGFEGMKQEDCALPYITLLQLLSKQLKSATKVAGAEAGMFYNTVTKELYKDGIQAIPCAFKKAWIEWKPRDQGGGFIAEHATADILKETVKNDKGKDIRKSNGNIIETTAYHYVLLVNADGTYSRALFSLASTQLKKSRLWNAQMKGLLIKLPNGIMKCPPAYSHIYTVKSLLEQKDQNEWYAWDFNAPKIITDPNLYMAAKSFCDDVVSGIVKAAPPIDENETPVSEPVDSEVM